MADIYKEILGVTRSQVDDAQQRLVNITLRLALEELYAEKGMIDPTLNFGRSSTTLMNDKGEDCSNAKETLETLMTFPETDRIRAYNKLAFANHFDLSLKSSGFKTPASLAQKKDRPVNSPVPRDIARITVISDETQKIEQFTRKIEKAIDDYNLAENTPSRGDAHDEWEMKGTGLIKCTVNKQIKGVSAEIMVVPRSQAVSAERISHMYFQTNRAWATYEKQLLKDQNEKDPETRDKNKKARPVERTKIIQHYNDVVNFINRLVLKEGELGRADIYLGEKVFASRDTSRFTFDEGSEGGKLPEKDDEGIESKSKGKFFSPIFTAKSIRTYRDYLVDVGRTLSCFSNRGKLLEPLDPESASHNQIESAMCQLKQLSQATHACYMKDAPLEVRTKWVMYAKHFNSLNQERDWILPELITSVARGRAEDKPVDIKAVDKALHENPVLREEKRKIHEGR